MSWYGPADKFLQLECQSLWKVEQCNDAEVAEEVDTALLGRKRTHVKN